MNQRKVLLPLIIVVVVTASDVYAQTGTDNIDMESAADVSLVLAALQESLSSLGVGVEDITSMLLLLSDDVNTADARIAALESEISQITNGENAATLLTITTQIDDMNAQVSDIRTQLGLFQGTIYSPATGNGNDSSPDPPVQSYARTEVVFDAPLATEAAGDTLNLVRDNAMHGIVMPRINGWLQEDISPELNNAPLIFRHLTLLTNAAFDAVAPYHPTAVGAYSRMDQRPGSESETNLLPNTAVMYASYRTMLEFAPHRADEWRSMMTDYGLDPDVESGLGLDCNITHQLSSPVEIGNHAAECVLDARHDDGFNHFGGEIIQPFGDTTGYRPVNAPNILVDPSRWSPLIVTNHDDEFVLQQFVTPQWANTETFSNFDQRSIRVPPPLDSNHRNADAYQAQADEVVSLRAALTGEDKIITEFFDNKLRELIHHPALKNIDDVVEYVQLEFLLNMAKFDAGTVIWQEKHRYDAVRPITAIHYLYDNDLVPIGIDANGDTIMVPGNDWQSYLQTADHPEYPSATTCFCAAYAESWRLYTGTDDIRTYVNGDSVIPGYQATLPAGSSLIEPGITPLYDVHVTFDTWSDYEHSCAASRVISGTHFWPAVEASVDTCNVVANTAFAYWEMLIHGYAPLREPAVGLDRDHLLNGSSWTGY
ncbi:MAG: hypothetical protein F4W68_06410 [Cenarchaeum sp. SB0661_bin_35]|nr:hypothetical protein [Cenarchaeum sp. SB0667_bin_13]MYC80109.1 hypothetical protein [Cenarchaeum sp. SB0661_bin_35]MYI51477.1 hypothetical protein [Cenarchaeum sp. SB0673_bin_9]